MCATGACQGSHAFASRSLSNRTHIIGIPQAAWTLTRHFTLSHAIAAGQRRCAPGGQIWSDAAQHIPAVILDLRPAGSDLRPAGQQPRAVCRSKRQIALYGNLACVFAELKLERDTFLAPQLAKPTAHRIVSADQRPSPVCARRTRTPSRFVPASRIDLTRARAKLRALGTRATASPNSAPGLYLRLNSRSRATCSIRPERRAQSSLSLSAIGPSTRLSPAAAGRRARRGRAHRAPRPPAP
jgi:hypothetical protein